MHQRCGWCIRTRAPLSLARDSDMSREEIPHLLEKSCVIRTRGCISGHDGAWSSGVKGGSKAAYPSPLVKHYTPDCSPHGGQWHGSRGTPLDSRGHRRSSKEREWFRKGFQRVSSPPCRQVKHLTKRTMSGNPDKCAKPGRAAGPLRRSICIRNARPGSW